MLRRWISALVLGGMACSPVLAQQALWLPPGADEALAAHASLHNDFTFDKSMLGIAGAIVQDDEARQAIAKLRSVTVDIFKYPQPGLYSVGVLNGLRTQYSGEGFKHVVASHTDPATGAPGRTDVWLRFEHGDIEGAVVMLVEARNIEIVAVDGKIDPLDLLHLRGHFGIPRFPDNDLNP
jgi:hypothetical protein